MNKIMTMDQIIKLQTSENWEDRIVSEFQLLLRREEGLAKMIEGYERGTLNFTPNCPIQLLKMQHDIMCKYLDVLIIRAKLERIDLNG